MSHRFHRHLLFLLWLILSGLPAMGDAATDIDATGDIPAKPTDSLLTAGCAEHMDSTGTGTAGQEQKRPRKLNIFKQFIKSFDDIDTTYIVPNYYNYAAMVQNTNFFQMYRFRATSDDGHIQTIKMVPRPSFRIGPYFGWRWIFLGYTFDMRHPSQAGEKTELSLSLYSSMLGVDMMYIRNKGNFNIRRVRGFGDTDDMVRELSFDGAETYTAGLNLYYVFNHRRFSYPAAFAQSTVQRRSQGSWMAGFRYDSQRIKVDWDRLPPSLLHPSSPTSVGLLPEMRVPSISYRNYSLSVGYAYNWVFAPRFLFSISLSPSIGLKSIKGERMTSDTFWTNVKNFNIDFIARSGLVWNTNQFFAGVSAITHFYDFRRDRFTINNMVNYVNLYVGFNFNKRKQYR